MSAVVLVGGKVLGSGGSVFTVGSGGGATGWKNMKFGAGGFCRGLTMAADGTLIARTDTNGAYLYTGGSPAWQQLFNVSSLPSAVVTANPLYLDGGCTEIQSAPTNTSILYGFFGGTLYPNGGALYVSSNKGTSWTATNFPAVINYASPGGSTLSGAISSSATTVTLAGGLNTNTGDLQPMYGVISKSGTPTTFEVVSITAISGTTITIVRNQLGTTSPGGGWSSGDKFYVSYVSANLQVNSISQAQFGARIAIDPNNANIVYVGVCNGPLYVTTDGGTSWNAVAGVPVAADGGFTGMLFNANGSVVGNVTQTLYVCSNGNGVYVTNNGGTTWSLTTSSPLSVQNAAIDTSGNYYAVTGTATAANQALSKYSGGTWSTTSAPTNNSTIQNLAINPFNNNMIVVGCEGGQIALSYNAGSTWTAYNNNMSTSSPDIGWIAAGNYNSTNGSYFLDFGQMAFSPTTNGLLWVSAGTGIWTTTLPTSGWTGTTAYVWTDNSTGIEQLDTAEIVVPPYTGSLPLAACWDRPFFKLPLTSYPTTYGPVVTANNPPRGYSVDYATSSPQTVFGIQVSGGYGSTDGGTTWTAFATQPPNFYTNSGNGVGGCIAASTPSNLLWAPYQGVAPSYSTNGGSTWTAISISGVSSWSGFQSQGGNQTRSVCADRVTANTFYLYYPGAGVFSTSNGGATWTAQYTANGGYIESNHSWPAEVYLSAMPGYAGYLFYTPGYGSGTTIASPGTTPFYRSINGGATWTTVANVVGVSCFGYGAIASGSSYPTVIIYGFVSGVLGVWQSTDNCSTWTAVGGATGIAAIPGGNLNIVVSIAGDPNIQGRVYVALFGGGGTYYG